MSYRVVKVVPIGYGASVTIEQDWDGAIGRMTRLRDKLAKPAPLYRSWMDAIRVDVRRQFSEGGDPAWKALAVSTILDKAGKGLPALTKKGRIPWRLKQGGSFGPANILIRNGRLRDSWSLKNDAEHIETIDEGSGALVVGSSNRVANWMQCGTKPYRIKPRSNGSLRFMGGDGKYHFSRLVHHPGIAARPIRVTNTLKQKLVELTEDYLRGE